MRALNNFCKSPHDLICFISTNLGTNSLRNADVPIRKKTKKQDHYSC